MPRNNINILYAQQRGRKETVADLNERLERGEAELRELLNKERAGTDEYQRLAGKIEGLLVVKDWPRSY